MKKRLISLLLALTLTLSLLPLPALAAQVPAEDEVQITEEMAAGLASAVFGADVGAGTLVDGAYEFEMPKEIIENVNENLMDASDEALPSDNETQDSEKLPVQADDANALPEGYVDNSNEEMYTYLKELTAGTVMRTEGSMASKKIDLIFVIDSTGSMSSSISSVKKNVAAFASYIGSSGAVLRIGLVDYRDITSDGADSTTVHQPGFSPWMDTDTFITELAKVSAGGGGDTNETPIDALGFLTKPDLGWSSDAFKFAVLITDAGYKNSNSHGIASMDEMITQLQRTGIQVSTITPSRVANAYEQLAALTGGVQIELSGTFAENLTDYAEAVMGSVSGAGDMRDYTLHVFDSETGLPLAGVTVRWNGGSTDTAEDGIAKITTNQRPVKNVTLSRRGYRTASLGDLYEDTDVKLATLELNPDDVASGDADDALTLNESMFKDPDSGKGSMSGPTLSILGRDFNVIDNVDVALNVPLFSSSKTRDLNLGNGAVKIVNDKENKLFKVTIGETQVKGDDVKDPDSSYWKQDYKVYKSIVQTFNKNKSARDIYNEFRTMRKELKQAAGKPKKGDIALPVDFEFAGYAEVSYASGALKFMEGGVVIGAMTKEFWASYPFPPFPLVFLKVTFDMDLTGKFGFIRVEAAAKTVFTPKANLDFNANAAVTVNLGAAHVAYVGGGMKGKLNANLALPIPEGKLEKGLKVNISGKFLINWKVFLWDDSADFGEIGPFQLYPWGGGRAAEVYSLGSTETEDLSLIGRPSPIVSRLGGSYFFHKNAAYENSVPQLTLLQDGTWLLVWVDAVESRSDLNMTGVYYATKAPSSTDWSTPALVDDDNTGDFMPVLSLNSDGSKAMLIWQNCKKTWDTMPTMDEMAGNIQLKSAVYDQGTKTFSTVSQLIDSEGRYETAVQITPSGDGMTAYWVETDPANVMLTDSAPLTIYQSVWDGSAWSDAVNLAKVHSLDGFAAGQIGGNTCVAYAQGSDIYCSNGGAFAKADTASGTVSSLQIADGGLYWSDYSGLKCWNGVSTTTYSNLSPTEFSVVGSGSSKVLLSRQFTGGAGGSETIMADELFASAFDGSRWSDPVMLTDYADKALSVPSAVMGSDGTLYWACGRYQAVSESDGSLHTTGSDLIVDSYRPSADVTIESKAHISPLIQPGKTGYASVEISNKGLLDQPISATIQIGEDIPQSASIYVDGGEDFVSLSSIGAGESVLTYIPFTVPAAMNGQSVTVTFQDGSGNKIDSALGTLPNAAPDIEVSDVKVARVYDHVTISAQVANVGAASADKVSINLTQEGVMDGADELKVLATQTVDAVTGTVTFAIDGSTADLVPQNPYDYKRFLVTAVPLEGEVMTGNNSDSAILAPSTATEITITGDHSLAMKGGDKIKLTYQVTPADTPVAAAWMSTNTAVATVDKDGTISAWGSGEADIIVSAYSGTEHEIRDVLHVTVTQGITAGVSGVTVSPGSTSLGVGQTVTLHAQVLPDAAPNKNVTWNTTDTALVKLEDQGDGTVVVTALSVGTATVVARTEDGGYTSTATIEVTEKHVPVTPPPDKPSTPDHGWEWNPGSFIPTPTPSSYAINLRGATNGSISADRTTASNGTTVTITVEPNAGYTLDKLTVTDGKGNAVPVSSQGSNKYTFRMPSSAVSVEGTFITTAPVSPSTSANPFIDVTTSDYFYDSIQWAVKQGITNGVSATCFAPDMVCTRAQAITFLWRAAGSPKPTAAVNQFADVKQGDYYYDAVLWAVENGVTNGISAMAFGPDVAVTRSQTVTFMYRAAKAQAEAGSNPFVDVEDSDYYADPVRWAVSKGITTGTSATTFGPNEGCTRGQIVTFLYRAR